MPGKLDELKARIQYWEGSMDIIGITEINPKNCRYYPGKAELQNRRIWLVYGWKQWVES